MDDLISRQEAIDALSLGKEILSRVLDDIDVVGTDREKYSWGLGLIESNINDIEELPPAQPVAKDINVPINDYISRQAAIDALNVGAELLRRVLDDADIVGAERAKYEWGLGLIESYISDMKEIPSAQPTLYGYPVEHLVLIARVLQKENFPPERIAEMLSDVGRIVEMVRDEFEETLRKAVEQCTMI